MLVGCLVERVHRNYCVSRPYIPCIETIQGVRNLVIHPRLVVVLALRPLGLSKRYLLILRGCKSEG